MFRLTDSAYVGIRNLLFLGADAAQPSAAIDLHGTNGGVGTNGEIVIEDCVFGRYPWTRGTDTCRMRAGVTLTGVNVNNDQFRIVRCQFLGPMDVGLHVTNTQSVWGSATDCTFTEMTRGVSTVASLMLVNPQFNWCDTDLDVHSTAKVQVTGYQSEHSAQCARLGAAAQLRIDGGFCLLDSTRMPAEAGALVSAFPSGTGQTLVMREVSFGNVPEGTNPRPTITFGPDPVTQTVSRGGGFHVKVQDCLGLYADQAEFAGQMWGAVPESRGVVEWTTRSNDGFHNFRNELRTNAGPGSRTTLATDVWDMPLTAL